VAISKMKAAPHCNNIALQQNHSATALQCNTALQHEAVL